MDIPVPFTSVFDYLQAKEGFTAESYGWTDEKTRRHYQGKLVDSKGRSYHVKMKDLKVDDPDDYNPLGGFMRTIWGHDIIKRMQLDNRSPVETPTITHAPERLNLGTEILTNAVPVAWIVTEYNEKGLLVPTLPDREGLNKGDWENFADACATSVAVLRELIKVDLDTEGFFSSTLKDFPEFAPYQSIGPIGAGFILAKKKMRCRWLCNQALHFLAKRSKRRICEYNQRKATCFGIEAFELKNIFKPRGEKAIAELVDLETAFWWSPYDMMGKFFIRLWANECRPDLATVFLKTLLERVGDGKEREGFCEEMQQVLIRKIKSGNHFDRLRRGQGKSSPSMQCRQKLEQELTTGGFFSRIVAEDPANFL